MAAPWDARRQRGQSSVSGSGLCGPGEDRCEDVRAIGLSAAELSNRRPSDSEDRRDFSAESQPNDYRGHDHTWRSRVRQDWMEMRGLTRR